MEKESIFQTSLDRINAVDNLISSAEFKTKSSFERQRIYGLRDRLENIAAEIWYNRTVKDDVISYIRNNYVNLDDKVDSSAVLTYSAYKFCQEIWNECHLLISKDVFDVLFNKTAAEEIKNIESKNLKLF